MKRFFLLMFLFCSTLAYADNKVYVDKSKGKEVIDLDGKKTIEEINKEFNGNFAEVTAERKTAEEDNAQRISQDKVKKDQDKQSAINKLKLLGFTDDEISSFIK